MVKYVVEGGLATFRFRAQGLVKRSWCFETVQGFETGLVKGVETGWF